MGVVCAAASALGWGLATYVAGLGAQVLDTTVGVALSLYASVLWAAILALALAPARAFLALDGRGLVGFALVGVLNFPVARALLYAAIREVGPSRAMALRGTGPIFAVAFSVLLGQGWPTGVSLVGMALLVAGAVLLGWERAGTEARPARARGFLLGLLAAMGFGSVPVLVRAFLPSAHSPLVGAVVALGTGALVQTSVTWAVRRGQAWWHGRGALRALGSYALSGALSGSANTTNYVAVSFLGAAETSALTSAAPLVTLLASRLLRGLREPLTPVLYLAGVLVVLGGALVALATPGNAPLGSG